MTVKEMSNLCDIVKVKRIKKIVKQCDYQGNMLKDKIILDNSFRKSSVKHNEHKDVYCLVADYDANIIATYSDGKVECPKTIEIIPEFKTTKNISIDYLCHELYTDKFCNDETDYCVLVYISSASRKNVQAAIEEFNDFVADIASRFKGSIKFVVKLFENTVDEHFAEILSESWNKEFAECGNSPVFTKVFVS